MKKWLLINLLWVLAYQHLTAQSLLSLASAVSSDTSNPSLLPTFVTFTPEQAPTFTLTGSFVNGVFGISNDNAPQLLNTQSDTNGFTHYRFLQHLNGIPIQGAQYLYHVRNNALLSINGQWLTDKALNTIANSSSVVLTKEDALGIAMAHIGASQYKWQLPEEEAFLKREQGDTTATFLPKAELVYVGRNGSWKVTDVRLAYKFDIYAHQPMSHRIIWVDVQTGDILLEDHHIHHADAVGTAVTGYSGTKPITTDSYNGGYRLRETGRGQGIETYDMRKGTNYGNAVDFTDSDNNWNNINAQKDQYATDVHVGSEMTYDYFKNIHNRNSIDNQGFKIRSYVHYNTNYVNAFWDGQRMTYGDGNATVLPLTSLDIVGHEITHGLTERTAGLIYRNESGALNESFSDIFGTTVEFYANPSTFTPNWTLGERLNFIIRDMSNPNRFNHPDTYQGTHWYTGTGDNGGVHYNSGVQNYWFYLLSVGGNGTNDKGNQFCVQSITMDKAAKIAFRNLTFYLTPTSTYAQAREGAIQAAIDLYGATSNEVIQVKNAWYAVGVGAAGTTSPCAVTANLTVSATTVSATANAANYPLSITANIAWTVSNTNSWFTITPASGTSNGSLTVAVQANTTTTTRTGTFTVTGGGITRTFTVNQAASQSVCTDTYEPNNTTTTATQAGTITSSWTGLMCLTAGDFDYVRFLVNNRSFMAMVRGYGNQIGSYQLTINISGNQLVLQTASRDGSNLDTELFLYDYVTGAQLAYNDDANGTWSRINYSIQEPAYLTLSTNSISTSAMANSATITLQSNVQWTLSNANTWFTVTPNSGTGNSNITIALQANTTPNSRSGTFTVIGGGISRIVTVTQTANNYLDLSSTNLTIPSSVSQASIVLTSNIAWTVSNTNSWFNVTPTSGTGNGNLIIAVQANNATISRSGTFTVSGGGFTRIVTITQNPSNYLNLSSTSQSFTSVASQVSVPLTSNVSWSVSNNNPWVTITPASGVGNGNLTVAVQANTTSNNRSGTFTVSGAGISRTFTINQVGVCIDAYESNNTIATASWAGTVNNTWTASMCLVSGDLDYVKFLVNNRTFIAMVRGYNDNKSGAYQLVISVSGNQLVIRTASRDGSYLDTELFLYDYTTGMQLAYNDDSNSTIWSLVNYTLQETAFITLSTTSVTAPSTANTATIALQSNIDWSVNNTHSWFTVAPAFGRGNNNLTINIQANTTTSSRTGTFTVSGGGISQTVTITQAVGNYLTLSSSIESIASTVTQINLALNSNINWTISNSNGWFAVSPTSGSGNQQLVLNIQANTGITGRSGIFTVSGAGLSRTFTLNQAGVCTDAYESNNTFSTASPLGMITNTITASMCLISSDLDYVRFMVNGYTFVAMVRGYANNKNGAYQLTIGVSGNQIILQTASRNGTSLDTELFLYDYATGTQIGYNDDANGLWSQINYSLPNSFAGESTVTEVATTPNSVEEKAKILVSQSVPDKSSVFRATSELIIAPNPNNGVFTASINANKDIESDISITDFSGRVLFRQSRNLIHGQNTIPLDSHLPNGIYLFKIETLENVQTKRFVINK